MAIQDFSDCECTYGNQFCEDEIDCKGCDSALTLNAKGKDPRQIVPNYLNDYVDSNEEPIVQNSWKQWKNIEQGKPISICQESSYLCGSDQTGYYKRITAKGQNDLAKYLHYVNSPFEMEAEPDFSQIDEVEKGDLITADSFNNLAEPLKTNIIGNNKQLNLLKFEITGELGEIDEISLTRIEKNEKEYFNDSDTFITNLTTKIKNTKNFIKAAKEAGYPYYMFYHYHSSPVLSQCRLAIFTDEVQFGLQDYYYDGICLMDKDLASGETIYPNDFKYLSLSSGNYDSIVGANFNWEDSAWNTVSVYSRNRYPNGIVTISQSGGRIGHIIATNYDFNTNLLDAVLNDFSIYSYEYSNNQNPINFLLKYSDSNNSTGFFMRPYPQVSQQTPIKAEFYQWLANTASKINTFPVDACKNCNEECQFCNGKTKQTST